MSDSMAPCLLWVRRDLRIADNQALVAASRDTPVVPVVFLSTWEKTHHWTGAKRQHFLCQCLASHAANLESLGGRLIVRHGDPVAGLRALALETRAGAIHCQADPDPHGKKQEQAVAQLCEELGIPFIRHHEVSVHAADAVETQTGQPYRVYTPFSKAWLALDKPRPVAKPRELHTPEGIFSEELPSLAHWGIEAPDAELVEAGERAARQRLKRALGQVLASYAAARDIPSVAGTSRLSQDLRFGLLSARTIHAAAADAAEAAGDAARKGIDKFIKELAWREFYLAILHHWPEVLDHEFNPDWRGLPWDEPGETFELWKQGRTGFPIVDAGMRELLATGYMHNRVRMITAMFLTKDLHLDWKLGESFFMQHLIDGEIASNNGGWQWSAGTGADAAPYFRIQNPWSQTKRYDPEGKYIRKWVPELAKVEARLLLDPPTDGKPIAKDYPLPCLDHHAERERTLAIFKRHKEQRR